MVQYREIGLVNRLVRKRTKGLKSNVPRGTYHENVATFEGIEFSAISWKDNKQVLLLSTYVGDKPSETL